MLLDKHQIETKQDFRFSLYSRGEKIGLGESFVNIMRQRIKDKDKLKVMSI